MMRIFSFCWCVYLIGKVIFARLFYLVLVAWLVGLALTALLEFVSINTAVMTLLVGGLLISTLLALAYPRRRRIWRL